MCWSYIPCDLLLQGVFDFPPRLRRNDGSYRKFAFIVGRSLHIVMLLSSHLRDLRV